MPLSKAALPTVATVALPAVATVALPAVATVAMPTVATEKGYNDVGRYSLSKRVYEFFLNDKRP